MQIGQKGSWNESESATVKVEAKVSESERESECRASAAHNGEKVAQVGAVRLLS